MKQPVLQFVVSGNVYRLAFHHTVFDVPVKGTIAPEHDRKIIGRTSCLIKTWPEGADPKNSTIVGQGVAECSAQDRYDKETGRRKALRRALQAAWPTPSHLWEAAYRAYGDRLKAA